MKVVKTYNDATLSGASLILKLQSVLGLYAYIRVYPTISAAAGATTDVYTTNLQALDDATLSKDCIVGFVVTSGTPYFTKAWRTISAESEAYAGTIASLQIHLDGYLSGIPRIAEVYINSTPYYYKVYPTMISAVIADAQEEQESQEQEATNAYQPLSAGLTQISELSEIEIAGLLKRSVNSGGDYEWGLDTTTYLSSVTASDIGLGDVENTKLSTWAGSIYITSVGKLNVTNTMIATSTSLKGQNLANTLVADANDTYMYQLHIQPTFQSSGKTGTVGNGICVAPMSGNTDYVQAITLAEQSSGSVANYGLVDFNDAYFGKSVSAASFIDRTPDFAGDGIEALRGVKGKKGQIDHKTLPEFARKEIAPTTKDLEGKILDSKGKIVNPPQPTEGRGIGEMISVLVKAVQQLTDRIEDLEKQIGGR